MTKYLDQSNALPEYMPYPRFLLKMDLSSTAKLVYMLLLDRYTLSKKNNWQDADGHIYLVYPVENLARDTGKGKTVISTALAELEKESLIRRLRKGFSTPHRIYLMIPEDTVTGGARGKKNDKIHFANERKGGWEDWIELHQNARGQSPSAENPDCTGKPDTIPPEKRTAHEEESAPAEPENRTPSDEKTEPTPPENPSSDIREIAAQGTGKALPNNSILNSVILNENHITSERAWGEFGNVMLTEAEYESMQREYPDSFLPMLDFLSTRIRDNEIPNEPHAVILRRILE